MFHGGCRAPRNPIVHRQMVELAGWPKGTRVRRRPLWSCHFNRAERRGREDGEGESGNLRVRK